MDNLTKRAQLVQEHMDLVINAIEAHELEKGYYPKILGNFFEQVKDNRWLSARQLETINSIMAGLYEPKELHQTNSKY